MVVKKTRNKQSKGIKLSPYMVKKTKIKIRENNYVRLTKELFAREDELNAQMLKIRKELKETKATILGLRNWIMTQGAK